MSGAGNYQRQYHCLLCLSLYVIDGSDYGEEFSTDLEAAHDVINNERYRPRFYTHYCADGGLGVALLAGYRKVVVHDIQ